MKESIYDNRSRCEKEVADLLKEMGIKWRYEQPVFVYDDRNRPRVWVPDFSLTQFGVYIEVCGSSNFNYEYRKKIFNNNGYQVIFLHLYKETIKWESHLISYLRIFTNYKNQKLNEIIKNNYNKNLCSI